MAGLPRPSRGSSQNRLLPCAGVDPALAELAGATLARRLSAFLTPAGVDRIPAVAVCPRLSPPKPALTASGGTYRRRTTLAQALKWRRLGLELWPPRKLRSRFGDSILQRCSWSSHNKWCRHERKALDSLLEDLSSKVPLEVSHLRAYSSALSSAIGTPRGLGKRRFHMVTLATRRLPANSEVGARKPRCPARAAPG